MADTISTRRILPTKKPTSVRASSSSIPIQLVTNTVTGAADLYVIGETSPAASASTNGDSWKINESFLKKYNNSSGSNLTMEEFEKVFAEEYKPILNNDRADVINKNSTEEVRTELSTKNKIPGVIDPKDETKSEGSNPSTESQSEPLDKEQIDFINKENEFIKNTRKTYEDAIYPFSMKSDKQDHIIFKIVKYRPSGLTGFDQSKDPISRTKIDEKDILSRIILPIPGNIQDSNQVNWSSGDLNPFEESVASMINTSLTGGNVGEKAKQEFTTISQDNQMKNTIISNVAKGVLGNNNIMQRQFGSIINPNVELLFNRPELRTFSFSFKLSPRSKDDAKEIKKIIRNFKQAMSVKRSTTAFLLKSPHTFQIEYIFQNKSHPYLNRFKECALTSCSVNYTPEGNYMSFDDTNEPSMVSYELNLTFQELEPLFDDEYDSSYTDIGY